METCNISIPLLLAFFLFCAAPFVSASDPDILSDFVLPQNLTTAGIDGNFFTFTGLGEIDISLVPNSISAAKATAVEFPALIGQSVSFAILIFPNGAVNPPHTHSRSAELLFVTSGTLEVGFIDTMNKLYTQTLQQGDMFVFPKGLVHFQYCKEDAPNPALAFSAFGSANAGTVKMPDTIFGTGIDDEVLAKSLKTDLATVKKIKAGLAPHH